jgi:hypothetical protein
MAEAIVKGQRIPIKADFRGGVIGKGKKSGRSCRRRQVAEVAIVAKFGSLPPPQHLTDKEIIDAVNKWLTEHLDYKPATRDTILRAAGRK